MSGPCFAEDVITGNPGFLTRASRDDLLHGMFDHPPRGITVLDSDSRVTLKVYDLLGKEVKSLADAEQSAGFKTAQWDGTDGTGKVVSGGMYFLRIEASTDGGKKTFTDVKKMLLVK